MSEEKMCDDCEKYYPADQLGDIGDPWGWGPRHWVCEACNDIRVDHYLENLYS